MQKSRKPDHILRFNAETYRSQYSAEMTFCSKYQRKKNDIRRHFLDGLLNIRPDYWSGGGKLLQTYRRVNNQRGGEIFSLFMFCSQFRWEPGRLNGRKKMDGEAGDLERPTWLQRLLSAGVERIVLKWTENRATYFFRGKKLRYPEKYLRVTKKTCLLFLHSLRD